MADHQWRQEYGIDPFREWGRRVLPNGSEGMVLSDIDVAVRRFGSHYGLDSDGDLMLGEVKTYDGKVGHGLECILNSIGRAFSKAGEGRFRGVFTLHIGYKENLPACPACGAPKMTAQEAFDLFLSAEKTLFCHPKGKAPLGCVVTNDELALFLEGKISPTQFAAIDEATGRLWQEYIEGR